MKDQTVSMKINVEGKNIILAYLMWWFLGWAGVHRFYLGHIKTGLTQLILFTIGCITSTILIGLVLLIPWFIWWALDAYFTYQMVSEENAKLGVEQSAIHFSKSGELNNELDQLEKLHALVNGTTCVFRVNQRPKPFRLSTVPRPGALWVHYGHSCSFCPYRQGGALYFLYPLVLICFFNYAFPRASVLSDRITLISKYPGGSLSILCALLD
ncbi:MAG: TM2 domain-containing protein [Gammaproteobacteria bacterium]